MKRYRFETRSIKDYRPLLDLKKINMPWWCTGFNELSVTIVCYLPDDEDLFNYWDDAFNIDFEDVKEIKYTDRFRKPKEEIDK